MSRKYITLLFVPAYALLSYAIIFFTMKRGWHKSAWGRWTPVVVNVLAFLILQHQNLIGILSATNQSSPQTAIALMGFAFYFLQILGIMISVFSGKVELPGVFDFLIVVTYFPKFLSGPIESLDFIQRVKDWRFKWNTQSVNRGITYAITGAIFKYLIADHLKYLVAIDDVQSPFGILRSTVAFEFQVYFDFCGYSLMAFGAAIIAGLPILLNFDHPFGAKDVPEFWRRWHIGLGRWFHTFVFEPLRDLFPSKHWRRIALPILVFSLSALWHGQTLNFFVWGLFHGISFAGFIFLNERIRIGTFFSRFYLFFTLIAGRFFFMDSDTQRMFQKLKTLFSAAAWKADFVNFSKVVESTLALMPQAQQGSFLIVVGLLLIAANVLTTDRENERPLYGLCDSDFVFLCATIMFFALIPVARQTNFVYGR